MKAQLTQLGLPISNLTATRILETSPTANFTLLLSSSSILGLGAFYCSAAHLSRFRSHGHHQGFYHVA